METGKWWLVGLQVIVVFVTGSVGAKIQLYKDKYYSEFLLELNLTNECYQVTTGPIVTAITDTCFIAYTGSDCTEIYSRKFLPGRASPPFTGIYVSSLQTCNATEGGSQLNIDIALLSESYSAARNILESYSNVCACLNVPNYVKKMSGWSIDNHHNGLYVYFEQDCNEKYSNAMYIDPGHWFELKIFHEHSRYYKGSFWKIQSLGPDKNSTYFRQSCSGNTNDNFTNLEQLEPFSPASHSNYDENAYPSENPLLSAAASKNSGCASGGTFMLLLQFRYWLHA